MASHAAVMNMQCYQVNWCVSYIVYTVFVARGSYLVDVSSKHTARLEGGMVLAGLTRFLNCHECSLAGG